MKTIISLKTIRSLIALSTALAATHALAWDWVLLDTDKAPHNWQITSQELGLKIDKRFSVSLRTLHGGRQEGVCIVDIDTGAMKISVVPTRGMNVLEAVAGKVRLGWDSPVSEVVNPAFIELNGRGGLAGWKASMRWSYAAVTNGSAIPVWITAYSSPCMAWRQHTGFKSRA